MAKAKCGGGAALGVTGAFGDSSEMQVAFGNEFFFFYAGICIVQRRHLLM
jgi:hypothetical protein